MDLVESITRARMPLLNSTTKRTPKKLWIIYKAGIWAEEKLIQNGVKSHEDLTKQKAAEGGAVLLPEAEMTEDVIIVEGKATT